MSDVNLLQSLTTRFGRGRLLTALVVAPLVLLIVVGTGAYYYLHQDTYSITAQFPQTPGLYDHNAVDILGVPTGHITSITPRPGYVEVVMAIPTSVKIPAGAQAIVVAANPVSDRTVELSPRYTGGATMARGATIPLARTVVPLEIDQVFTSLDNLDKALGPTGVNSNGSLSDALDAFARLADGKGNDINAAIRSVAAALPSLTADPDQLKQLVEGLSTLTSKLAQRNSTINSIYGDLSGATGELAAEKDTLASAITNLQQGLAQAASFITANQSTLGSSLTSITATLNAIVAQKNGLQQLLSTAPTGFQNFNNAITLNGPCPATNSTGCPGVFGRLDFAGSPQQVQNQYCGSSLTATLPILGSALGIASANTIDTLCIAAYAAFQGHPTPPGSPAMPAIQLAKYLGP